MTLAAGFCAAVIKHPPGCTPNCTAHPPLTPEQGRRCPSDRPPPRPCSRRFCRYCCHRNEGRPSASARSRLNYARPAVARSATFFRFSYGRCVCVRRDIKILLGSLAVGTFMTPAPRRLASGRVRAGTSSAAPPRPASARPPRNPPRRIIDFKDGGSPEDGPASTPPSTTGPSTSTPRKSQEWIRTARARLLARARQGEQGNRTRWVDDELARMKQD